MKKTIIFTLFLFLIFTASCGIGDNIGVKTQDPVIETPTPTESKVTEVPLTETPEETPPPTPEPTKTPQKTTPKPTSTPSPTPHIDNTLAVDIGVFTFNNELGMKDGMYTIGEDFEMLLEEKEEHEFNKYIIKYTSTDYLKGYIHYSLGRTSHLEEFFLEPGTNKEFSSLVDGFFNNQKGAKIKKIALNSIKGSSANFKLVDFKADIVSVPATVVYLENDYHKVGIDLLWGGAINYIKDKTNKDGSLDNLLNRADKAEEYRQFSNNCKESYRALVKTDKYLLDTDRQARLVRPLALDMLDSEQKKYAEQRLIKALDNYDWRVGTGFLSTPFILDVLKDINPKYAYRLLENEEMPGWLFMPKNGATTVWEAWEGPESKKGGIGSLNHYSKGAVCRFLFDTVCGIKVSGDNEFIVSPLPGGSLTYAKASFSYCLLCSFNNNAKVS
jgi:hypothetical protein